ncbi:MAG TPA: MFS transporter [Candidatus Limnocylindrales bacterium]|nr:MFS transporter [Candidatus Limnocylindrales bacterium]
MIGHHPYHLHKLQFTEISEIYTSETIKTFAYSLIGIFLPIYLLQNGVSLQSLFILFILINVFRFFLELPVGHLIARFGAKHVMAISYPLSFLYIALLAVYPSYPTPLYIIAALWAIADSLHWVAYQSLFSKAKSKGKSGRQIGLMGILSISIGALVPLLGGYIAAKFGLQAVFMIAPILLLIAMVPLFQSMETVRSKRLNFSGLVPTVRRDMVAHAALSFDVVAGMVLWPLFIFMAVQDYFKLGLLVSLSFIPSLIAFWFAGRISDTMSKKRTLAVGAGGLFVVNAFRAAVTGYWSAFGVHALGVIVGPLLSIPLYSIFYSHADRTRRIEYTVVLEMAADASRALTFALLLGISLIASQQNVLRAGFVMAAIAILATNVVQLKLRHKRPGLRSVPAAGGIR